MHAVITREHLLLVHHQCLTSGPLSTRRLAPESRFYSSAADLVDIQDRKSVVVQSYFSLNFESIGLRFFVGVLSLCLLRDPHVFVGPLDVPQQ